MLSIAQSRLSANQYGVLLRQRATGIFFREAPMLFYGSTFISFAAAFGLRKVIATVMATDEDVGICQGLEGRLIDPNQACPLTGFMPLHVAVANGRLRMYDFLSVRGAPDSTTEFPSPTAEHPHPTGTRPFLRLLPLGASSRPLPSP